MPSAKTVEIPLRERVGMTVGEAAAFSRHSPAWVHQQDAIGRARAEAERRGEPVDESKGKGLRSIKAGGRRLILIDSLLELMGITRADLPAATPSPPPQAPRSPSARRSTPPHRSRQAQRAVVETAS
jgi:hypothetical protein